MTIPIPSDEALNAAYYGDRPCSIKDGLRAVATLAAKQAAEQAVKEALHKFYGLLVMNEGLGVESFAVAREMLCHYFPSPLTPTPPKEQQPVTSDPVFGPRELPTLSLVQQVNGLRQQLDESREIVKLLSQELADTKRDCPSPDPATVRLDEATVRACIETIEVHRQDRRASSFTSEEAHFDDGMERAIEHLSSLLPKPTPAPEPERYVTVEEVADAMKDIGGTLVASRCAVLSRLDKHAAKRGPMLTPERAVASMRAVFSNVTAKESDELLAALRLAAKQGGVA